MKTVRLRYTGELTVTFSTANVGIVEPGGEFEVPEDMADRFLARRDIEEVNPSPRSRRTPKDTGSDQGGNADLGERGALTETGTGDPDAGTLV